MARTLSNMVALGTKAAFFNLPDALSGKMKTLNDTKGNKGTLVMFIAIIARLLSM